MNKPEQENLKELFGRFMDQRAANEAAEDIRKADQLLDALPAPQPDDRIIARVKSNVAFALKQRQTSSIQWRIWATVGVAAALVIGTYLSLRFFDGLKENRMTTLAVAIPDRVWEGSDITSDDAEIAILTAEVETLRNTVYGAQIDDSSAFGNITINDLEMELVETNGDLWKG